MNNYAVVLLAALPVAACASTAPSPARVRAYYFGNSLIENSMPPFHADLGRSAGKEWSSVALIEGGAALYNVFDKLERDDRFYAGNARSLLEGAPWDAIVLQPAKWIGLHRRSAESGEPVQGPDREIGDVASASGIIDRFLAGHPQGITEDRARVVNETIWEVVTAHPHTGISAR